MMVENDKSVAHNRNSLRSTNSENALWFGFDRRTEPKPIWIERRAHERSVEERKKKMKLNKITRKNTLIIALYIKNAFNSAWRPKIAQILGKIEAPRKVADLCMENNYRWCNGRNKQGVPTRIRPGIDFMTINNGRLVRTDDQIIIISTISPMEIENKRQVIWHTYNVDKIEIMFIPRRKTRSPR